MAVIKGQSLRELVRVGSSDIIYLASLGGKKYFYLQLNENVKKFEPKNHREKIILIVMVQKHDKMVDLYIFS